MITIITITYYWDSSYITNESVNIYVNDNLSEVASSTYNGKDVVLNNVKFTESSGYMFSLTLESNLVPVSNMSVNEACNKSHGCRLIWTGNTWETMGSGPSDYNPSTNIKEFPYIVKGCMGSHLNAYSDGNYSYEIWARYVNNTSTILCQGSACYTVKFQYLYPYLTKIGDYVMHSFEYPNIYVINDDSDKTKQAVTIGKNYSQTSGIVVQQDSSWMYNNKYYVKYTIGIKAFTAAKFNSGDYGLQVGVHVCTPQVFRTYDLEIR